jgi:hypothetical protein
MIERLYQSVIQGHFSKNRQMLFLSGPRQVGKTTSSLSAVPAEKHLNWDNKAHPRPYFSGAYCCGTPFWDFGLIVV